MQKKRANTMYLSRHTLFTLWLSVLYFISTYLIEHCDTFKERRSGNPPNNRDRKPPNCYETSQSLMRSEHMWNGINLALMLSSNCEPCFKQLKWSLCAAGLCFLATVGVVLFVREETWTRINAFFLFFAFAPLSDPLHIQMALLSERLT